MSSRPAREELVEELYRVVLRREVDPEARAEAARRLADGTLTPSALLADLVSSTEFARLRAIEDGIALARRCRAAGERPRALTGPAETDERVVEIPWVLGRVPAGGRVLDVGSANAEPLYLEALLAAAPGAVGVDLAPTHASGLRVERADLRRLPFAKRSFDAVCCISTLEHVGSSQEPYGIDADTAVGGIPEALAEIRRVLVRSGHALVTVPCGREQDHGWFVQHRRDGWNRLFARADLYVSEQELYVLAADGWRIGDDDGAGYAERGPAASAVLCSELRPGRHRHALAAGARRLRRRV
jgi:SAM-dependent methyltransferase